MPRSRASGTTPSVEPVYSETLELDLSTVVPSLAGPKRPQDRVSLTDAKASFRTALRDYVADDRPGERTASPACRRRSVRTA
jgi:aconitate hydratase